MNNIKNVVLAVLVAYVVIDLCTSFILKKKRPLMFSHLYALSKKERRKVVMTLGLGALAGGLTYYLVNKYSTF